MRCDLSAEDADAYMTSCQADIQQDLASSKDSAEQSSSCCSAGLLTKRASGCPAPPGQNPPPQQPQMRTFRCDFDRWPNVCANARSAIPERGRTDTLNDAGPGSELHKTEPRYQGKWKSGSSPGKTRAGASPDSLDGWALIDRQVEEYPFGSGNPKRSPNNRWWDNKLITKTIEYHTSAGGTVTSIATTETVSAYCQHSSPGRKIWNGQQWAPHALGGSFDQREGDEEFNWYMCDSFPGYNGPSGRPATRKRRRDRVQVNSGHESQPQEAPRRHPNYRNQTAVDHALLKLSSSPMSGTIGPHPRPRPVLAARQVVVFLTPVPFCTWSAAAPATVTCATTSVAMLAPVHHSMPKAAVMAVVQVMEEVEVVAAIMTGTRLILQSHHHLHRRPRSRTQNVASTTI